MDSTLVAGIMQRVDVLAQKLGIAADHLWGVLLKQAQIEARVDVTLGRLFLFGGIVVFLWNCIKFHLSDHGSNYYNDDAAAWWFLTFLWLPMMIVGICLWVEGYKIGLNPEYWALRQIKP
jgi:hypothetical protein